MNLARLLHHQTKTPDFDVMLLTNGELSVMLVWNNAGQPDGWDEQLVAIMTEAYLRQLAGFCPEPMKEPWLGRSCPTFLAAPCHPGGCPAYPICPTKGAGRRVQV